MTRLPLKHDSAPGALHSRGNSAAAAGLQEVIFKKHIFYLKST